MLHRNHLPVIIVVIITLAIAWQTARVTERLTTTPVHYPKIYIINLERSPDRLQDITAQTQRARIQFQRWKGTDGAQLDLTKLTRQHILHPKHTLAQGAIGTSLSHLRLWKHCYTQNEETVIVMEDDCLIPPNFKSLLQSYLQQLPDDWDIFYLGASNIYGRKISKNILKPLAPKTKTTENTGFYAMMIKRKTIPSLLQAILPIKKPIDVDIRKVRPTLKVFIANPPIVQHNNQIHSIRKIISNKPSFPSWKDQAKITIV